jgi:hypothetical protein
MWMEIFTFIPYLDLLLNVSLVNHYWYEMVRDRMQQQQHNIFKHQSVAFNFHSSLAMSFITTYKPTNVTIEYDSSKCNSPTIIEHLIQLEKFVTKLKLNDKYNKKHYLLLDIFSEHVNRFIFPHLVELNNKMIFNHLTRWFGTDLSRFKRLSPRRGSSDAVVMNATFGSLQKISFSFCGDFETDIVKQNLQTLKRIKFFYIGTDFNSQCLELIAPVILSLKFNINNDVLIVPYSFSKLEYIDMTANASQIKQFFTVTHPMLIKVNIREKKLYNRQSDAVFSPQPSIRIKVFNRNG